jgi:hypothetical protein
LRRRETSPVVADLKVRGLLREAAKLPKPARGPAELLVLCEGGALGGGLSVALDVQPDEVVGALCALIGGSAPRLRILDVRKKPFELLIQWEGQEERWDVPDLPALVHNLNDLLRDDDSAQAVALLGEWQDALQLWCLPKTQLLELLGKPYFAPQNEADLESLARRAAGG